MDPKEIRNSASVSISDDNIKYVHSSPTLPSNKNKSYLDIGSNVGKVDTTARPCAIIGPDRVLPHARRDDARDAYLKKATVEPWPCQDNVYHQLPDYPQKVTDYQPTRNISPRQTFQENMQRIMVPPTYSSIKNSDESNLKNAKLHMPQEAKFCDVPYNTSSVTIDQKSARNTDIPLSSVNPTFSRSVPYGWASGVNGRPPRPYAAPEFYQYPEYSSCAAPRQATVSRMHRSYHEETAQAYSERLYQEENIRFKPYPTPKEKHQQTRYDYVHNYPNTFHPPGSFPPHKYDLQKPLQGHPYPIYPQVKYLDRRIPEPFDTIYQRPNQTNINVPFRNQAVPPPYGPVPGNYVQNKSYADISSKPMNVNKLHYESNNKMYLDLETSRNKGQAMAENMYFNEMNQMRSKILPSNHSVMNMHSIPQHQIYRRDITHPKPYEYNLHYRNLDPSCNLNYSLPRLPLQYSPNAIAISPSDSNTSNDTTPTMGTSQEDCGYVSQSSTTSIRSLDLSNMPTPNDFLRRREYTNFGIVRSSLHPNENTSHFNKRKINSASKKNINVRQFLQMWNEGEDEINDSNEAVSQIMPNNLPMQSKTHQEQLYILGSVNVPTEDLSKYEHIQKISKLPENIIGYNNNEILNQYEKLVELPSIQNNFISKMTLSKEKNSFSKNYEKENSIVPRPLTPLDVEAKISQSVIHKEVGCNFEIKPCSPEMLNVEIATPVQNVLGERIIEKVANPIMSKSPMLHRASDTKTINAINKVSKPINCHLMNAPYPQNNYPNLSKSTNNNYNLQDFNSNSGISLASLPRLDNDIELNFPEINQQFIIANKIESDVKSPAKDLPNINLEQINDNHEKNITQHQNILSPQLCSVNNAEKEVSKLSKYRKNKKCDLTSAVNKLNESVTVQQRVDSVIIKNPDNIKLADDINEVGFSVTNIVEENLEFSLDKENKSKTEKSQLLSNNESREMCDFSFETAIDFSLNKTDRKDPLNEKQIEKNNTNDIDGNYDNTNGDICGSDVQINDENFNESETGIKQIESSDSLSIQSNDEIDLSVKSILSATDLNREGNVPVIKQLTFELEGSKIEEQICLSKENDMSVIRMNDNISLDINLKEESVQDTNMENFISLAIITNLEQEQVTKKAILESNTILQCEKLTESEDYKKNANCSNDSNFELNYVSNEIHGNILDTRVVTTSKILQAKELTDIGMIDDCTKDSSNLDMEHRMLKVEVCDDIINSVEEFKKPEEITDKEKHDVTIISTNKIVSKESTTREPEITDCVKLYSSLYTSENILEPKHLSVSNNDIKDTDIPHDEFGKSLIINKNDDKDIPEFVNSEAFTINYDCKKNDKPNEKIDKLSNNSNKREELPELSTTDLICNDEIHGHKKPCEEIDKLSVLSNEDSSNVLKSELPDSLNGDKCNPDVHSIYNSNSLKVEQEIGYFINNDDCENNQKQNDKRMIIPESRRPESVFINEVNSKDDEKHLEDKDKSFINLNENQVDYPQSESSVFVDNNNYSHDEDHDGNKNQLTTTLKNGRRNITESDLHVLLRNTSYICIKKSPEKRDKCNALDIKHSNISMSESFELNNDGNCKSNEKSYREIDETCVNLKVFMKSELSYVNNDDSEPVGPCEMSDNSIASLDDNINDITELVLPELLKSNETSYKEEDESSAILNDSNDISKLKPAPFDVNYSQVCENPDESDDKFQNLLKDELNVVLKMKSNDCLTKNDCLEDEIPYENSFSKNNCVSETKNDDEPTIHIGKSEPDMRSESIDEINFVYEKNNHCNISTNKSLVDETSNNQLFQKVHEDENETYKHAQEPNLLKSISNLSNFFKSKDSNHFYKELFSPWIQKLLVKNEGNCKFVESKEELMKDKIQEITTDNCSSESHNNILKEICRPHKDLNSIKSNNILLGSEDDKNDINFCDSYTNIENNDQNNKLCEYNLNGLAENGEENTVTEFFSNEPVNDSPIFKRRKILKRSISESALQDLKENEDSSCNKRRKVNQDIGQRHIIPEDFCNIIQSNRRNSISTFYNEDNLYIVIDNDLLLTEEANEECEKIIYTEISEEDNVIYDESGVDVANTSITNDVTSDKTIESCEYSSTSVEESWVEDVACIETVISEDVTEEFECAVESPGEYNNSENLYDESPTFSDSEHIDKIKNIYGTTMCSDNSHLLETLYRTPQMDVNKTLADIESHNTCEDTQQSDNDLLERDFCPEQIEIDTPCINCEISNEKENIKHFSEYNNIDIPQSNYENLNSLNDYNLQSNHGEEKEDVYTTPLCDWDNDNLTVSSQKSNSNYSCSSSPEVSSTTSEDKNSSILLKITKCNGSRVSQINDNSLNRLSYKLTENNDYRNYNTNYSSSRPLITKAAQKYIPPIKESIGDLKVKLHLPQHRLNILKQLKMSKAEPKIDITRYDGKISKQEQSKKPKPKFEDVLKSIDEIHFKKQKDKVRKTKNAIPRVIIKKSENGAHYASSKADTFNPDLTGRKWQPWVFLEKNDFIDRMAIKNKVTAVYCHRKNAYILAEKFKKYKSIYNANFVISRPRYEDPGRGNLKYTIKLKHT